MPNKLEKELFKAAVLTFEDLGLMLPSPELDDEQMAAQAVGAVSVDFTGPFTGKLVLRVCGDVLNELTANMLGEDENPLPDQCWDALGEIANVICGNVLPQIAGMREVFNLSGPEMVVSNCVPNLKPSAQTRIGIELGRAELELYVDDNAAPYFEEHS